MCQFMASIILPDESRKGGYQIFRNAWTDSHEDLIRLYNLQDNKEGTFARIEFRPADDADMDKPEKYLLKIDQESTPAWLTTEMQGACAEQMRGWVKSMLITGGVDLLCGGAYIVAGSAKINTVKNTIVHVCMGSAKIGSVCGSAQIDRVCGSAQIDSVCGSAKIGSVCGSAQIDSVFGSAQIDRVFDSAQIDRVFGSAKIGRDERVKK